MKYCLPAQIEIGYFNSSRIRLFFPFFIERIRLSPRIFLYGIYIILIYKDLVVYLTKSSGINVVKLFSTIEYMMFVCCDMTVKIKFSCWYIK